MAEPTITGVHAVGSVPLSSTEETFRTFCKALPGRLRRIPDGETGDRKIFSAWQAPLFSKDKRLQSQLMNPETPTSLTDGEADKLLAPLATLETGYDEAALQSYEVFKKMRKGGDIPEGVRFQVSLPTPVSIIGLHINRALAHRAEILYEKALFHALKHIEDAIPASDLSVQWDAPIEFAILEGAEIYGYKFQAWFEPVFDGIVERLARIGDRVQKDVGLGYHFCYGDVGHQHFKQPKDTGLLVRLAVALLDKCSRPVNYIHMPVPQDRTDKAYFEPLQELAPKLGETELILGLVHYNDLEGTHSRIQSAGEFVSRFGVATECGLGRTPPEQLQSILDISAAVSKTQSSR